MGKYTVYFEIGGKKMKMKIEAHTKEFAKEAVRSKIIFYKIENEDAKLTAEFSDLFDTIFKKK